MLSVFIDPMYVTSLVGVLPIPDNLKLEAAIDLPPEQLACIDLDYTNLNRIALASGLDYSYKGWTVGLGFAVPLCDFLVHPLRTTLYEYVSDFSSLRNLYFDNLIFNWGYTIRL